MMAFFWAHWALATSTVKPCSKKEPHFRDPSDLGPIL